MFKTLPKLDQYHGLLLKGPDAADFAQRLFTRDLRKIAKNEGKLCLFLDSEARVIGIFWLIRTPSDDIELYIPDFHWERMQEKLALFQFTERFEREIFPVQTSYSLNETNHSSEFRNYSGLISEGAFHSQWNGLSFRFVKSAAGEDSAQQEHWEWARIRAGIAKEPEDFGPETICLKLGWEELCDESKGCYAGQEIIERVRTRGGQSPEKLVVLHSKEKPQAGESLTLEEDPVGRITDSIAKEPNTSASHYVSLAYLKKKAQAESTFQSSSGVALIRKS